MNIFKGCPSLVSSCIAAMMFCGSLGAQGLGQLKIASAGSELAALTASTTPVVSLSTIAAGSMGNAAGAIDFCMKKGYLSGEGVASVKDRLLRKMISTGKQSPETDTDYISGTKGIVCCGSGPATDLSTSSLKTSEVKKACEKVLEQGKSML